VVDCPVSVGITGGAELNDFFIWAEHLNNYHTEVKNISYNKFPKGYHPLRFQNEASAKADKFSAFLLRKSRSSWSVTVGYVTCQKPEDLFSVISNAEAKNEAETKLQNF